MPLISTSDFSPANAPYEGVIPQPHATSLSGESYKYASRGGRRRLSKKHRRLTKKAKKNSWKNVKNKFLFLTNI